LYIFFSISIIIQSPVFGYPAFKAWHVDRGLFLCRLFHTKKEAIF
jgi:hypothetical protein